MTEYGEDEGVRNVLKVSELNNSLKEREYEESERGKYEVWKRVRKAEQATDEMVKDVNGQILCDGLDVRKRWAEYFDE